MANNTDMAAILQAWPTSTLKEVLKLHTYLFDHRLGILDVKEYISQYRYNRQHHVIPKTQFVAVLCPRCSQPMELHPVNTSPEDQIPDKKKHAKWWCPSCDVYILEEDTVQDLMLSKGYMGKMIKRRESNVR